MSQWPESRWWWEDPRGGRRLRRLAADASLDRIFSRLFAVPGNQFGEADAPHGSCDSSASMVRAIVRKIV